MTTVQSMKENSKYYVNTVLYIPLENTLSFSFCICSIEN